MFTLFYYFDGDSVQLLPTGAVGEANHEVIVAGSSIGRNLDVVMGVVLAQTGRDGKALVIDPGCAFAVFVFMFGWASCSASANCGCVFLLGVK